MLTLLAATVGLGFFYGALWHNQPARNPNPEERGQPESPRPLELIAAPPAVETRHDRNNEKDLCPEKTLSNPPRCAPLLRDLAPKARLKLHRRSRFSMESHHHEIIKRQSA